MGVILASWLPCRQAVWRETSQGIPTTAWGDEFPQTPFFYLYLLVLVVESAPIDKNKTGGEKRPMHQGENAGDRSARTTNTDSALWSALPMINGVVIIFLGAGLSAALTWRFINNSVPGVAQVVSAQPRPVGKGHNFTDIALVTPDGRRLRTTLRGAYLGPHTQVAVRYRTEPSIDIRPVAWLWSSTQILLGFGCLAAMATAIFSWHLRLRQGRG